MDALASWKREYQQLDEYNEEVITTWSFKGENWSHLVTVREFPSEWGYAKHICIGMTLISGKSSEPSMLEKRKILDGTKAKDSFEDPVAFEIFPAKERIVDKYDVYHLWMVKKEMIPFYVDVRPLLMVLNWKSTIVNGKKIEYTSRTYFSNGFVKVYFLKTKKGEMLRWYDKQNFKDEIIGASTIAIELVTEANLDYSVLICVPERIGRIPFGLR